MAVAPLNALWLFGDSVGCTLNELFFWLRFQSRNVAPVVTIVTAVSPSARLPHLSRLPVTFAYSSGSTVALNACSVAFVYQASHW